MDYVLYHQALAVMGQPGNRCYAPQVEEKEKRDGIEAIAVG